MTRTAVFDGLLILRCKWCGRRTDGRDVVGVDHRLVLPQQDAGGVIDGHSLGMQVKHDHPKRVRDSGEQRVG